MVFGIDVIHHIENPVAALAEWRSRVKSGGTLLFLEANMANPVMWWRHFDVPAEKRAFLNNKRNFTAWLSAAGWKNIIVKTVPAYLPSGPEWLWRFLEKTENFIYKIPLMPRLSAQFLVCAENQ
jgi:SAM-dependent methyltransferase